MSVLKCACPNCRRTLQITQVLPARVQCPGCGKSFTVSPAKKKAAAAIAAGGGAPAETMHQLAAQHTMPMPADPVIATGYRRRSGSGLLFWIAGGVMALVFLAALCGGGVYVAIYGLPGLAGQSDYDVDKIGGTSTKNEFGDGDTERAVKLGVEYLKKRIMGPKNLYYNGPTADPHVGASALAGMTLLECGVSHTDPALVKVTNTVYEAAPTLKFTYSVALAILFLDRLSEEPNLPAEDAAKHQRWIKKFAVQLIAAQHPKGGWGYLCQNPRPAEEKKIWRQLKNGTFVRGRQNVLGQYKNTERDNSIAQFALLALWTARKHDVPVKESLILEEKRYLREQEPDGSWTYSERIKRSRDATTCAGLIGLAVGRAIRDDDDRTGKKNRPMNKQVDFAKLDQTMQKGLTFIGKAIGTEPKLSKEVRARRHWRTGRLLVLHEKLLEGRQDILKRTEREIEDLDDAELATGIIFGSDAWGDLYFLWSVERVAVIYGRDRIDGKDWYRWGREIILRHQVTDPKSDYYGAWKERFPGVPDTCFALLFLRRANIVKDLTDKLRRLMAALSGGGRLPPMPARRDA